jgi:type IV pilus assembly protein PilE
MFAVKNKMQGFTLIELMIVVAIVAILAALAYPSYQESVRKSNRADGMATALDVAQQMERCYTTYGAYDNDNCPADTVTSPEKHYEISVEATATTFTVTATPVSDIQKKDAKCDELSITNTGKKSASGSLGDDCW